MPDFAIVSHMGIACGTYMMNWCSGCGSFFRFQGEYFFSKNKFLHIVFLLLCILFFKSSNLFFLFTYRLQQRKLLALQAKLISPSGIESGQRILDLSVQIDGVVQELRRSPQTYHSMNDLARRTDNIKALCERTDVL